MTTLHIFFVSELNNDNITVRKFVQQTVLSV